MTLTAPSGVDAEAVTPVDTDQMPVTERTTDLELYTPRAAVDVEPRDQARVGCVIPAYNEEGSIGQVLEALLEQTRPPEIIHVICNNCTDDTFYEAREYAGPHERTYRDRLMRTEVYVHDIGKNAGRKVAALNYGYHLLEGEGYDYLLGVDGDTIVHRRAVQHLLDEIARDERIGGLSAIYTVDPSEHAGVVSRFLVAGQRQQFADFTLQNLLRGRNMAVLGGQCSIFSMQALADVAVAYRQGSPWVTDSEVEDSLLSLQIKRVGYLTRISAEARADVGGMTTLKSLDAQQVKWNRGAIGLMWPGQRGTIQGQPFHPNLRLRWAEHVSMLFNILVRVGFILLLAASLSIGAYVFHPVWLIPPAVAVLLNLRIALSMKHRSAKDVLFALLFVPGEIYMWIRMGHFIRAWASFFTSVNADGWAAQAKAEQGRGGAAYLQPLLFLVVILTTLVLIWVNSPLVVQETILWFAWPALVVLSVIQTLVMVRRLLRRHYGYSV